MSGAFIKEQNGDDQVRDATPERPQSLHPNYVTPGGHARLQSSYQTILQKQTELASRPESPLIVQQRTQLDRELRYLKGRLERAVIVDPAQQPHDEVRFGAQVEARDENDTPYRLQITGEDEADATQGKISWISPLGQSMMGAHAGDTIVWKRPAGDKELEIIRISYPDS
jgi:transcription elongation GreA/GreB family factor